MESQHAKKKPQKIILTLGIGVLVVILIWFFAKRSSRADGASSTLSTRSQEFLATQKASESSQLRYANFQGDPSSVGGRKNIGTCLSVDIPAHVSMTKNRAECAEHFFLEDPKANLVVAARNVSYASVLDDSGVAMRQKESKLYVESSHTSAVGQFTVFKANDKSRYESSAFGLVSGQLISVSITANTNQDLDALLQHVLDSITLL